MTPIDITLAIGIGTQRRTVPVIALAAALRLPVESVREALSVLVFGPPGIGDNVPSEGEPAPSWSGCARDTLHSNERPNAASSSPSSPSFLSVSRPSSNERSEPTPSDSHSVHSNASATSSDAHARAREIAMVLGAAHDVAWIERLVRTHDVDLIDLALARTLAVPAPSVRTNYVAVFTAIVRYAAAERAGR